MTLQFLNYILTGNYARKFKHGKTFSTSNKS